MKTGTVSMIAPELFGLENRPKPSEFLALALARSKSP